MGGEKRSDGVGIFIAEKWVDSVLSIERQSKKVLILKMALDTHTHTHTTILRLLGTTATQVVIVWACAAKRRQ